MIRKNIDLSFPSPPPTSLDERPEHSICFHAGFSPPPLCVPHPFPGHPGAGIWSLAAGEGIGEEGKAQARDEEDAHRPLSMSIEH